MACIPKPVRKKCGVYTRKSKDRATRQDWRKRNSLGWFWRGANNWLKKDRTR